MQRKYILLPLADGEEPRVPQSKFIKYYEKHTSDIKGQYSHIFYSEVGKFLSTIKEVSSDEWYKMYGSSHFGFRLNLERKQEVFGVTQNRRFFKNLENLEVYSENEVILANEEWLGGLTLLKQFQFCHPKYYSIFYDICTRLKVTEKYFWEVGSFSPHNIFLSKFKFFIEYGTFLDDILEHYFDPSFEEKVGAWMAERLLHIFAHQYYKVKTEDFITLPKVN